MKGFWNDPEGLTIDEFAALMVIPLFLFYGARMAIADDISPTQVDFFTVLTYPILAVVARKAVERFGFPVKGRREQVSQSIDYCHDYAPPAQPPPDIPYREERIDANTRV